MLLVAAAAPATPVWAEQRRSPPRERARDLVTLRAEAAPGASAQFEVVKPDGSGGGPLTLATGSVLVITDLEVALKSSTGAGVVRGFIGTVGSDGVRFVYDFDLARQRTDRMTLAGGSIFSAPPTVRSDPATPGTVHVLLFGHLARGN
jgi:hypothetical protein